MATQFSLSIHSRQFLYLQISDLLEKVEAGVNLMAMSVRDLKSKPGTSWAFRKSFSDMILNIGIKLQK